MECSLSLIHITVTIATDHNNRHANTKNKWFPIISSLANILDRSKNINIPGVLRYFWMKKLRIY